MRPARADRNRLTCQDCREFEACVKRAGHRRDAWDEDAGDDPGALFLPRIFSTTTIAKQTQAARLLS